MKRRIVGIALSLAGCARGPASPQTVAVVPSPPALAAAPTDAPQASPPLVTTGDDTLTLEAVAFSDLPGWHQDTHGEAVGAFSASCEQLAMLEHDEPVGSGPYGGQVSHWQTACEAAASIETHEHSKARSFFETHFDAYAAQGKAGPEGRFTGYYVQPLRASRKRGGRYQFPLYKRPPDLVSVKLDDFVEDGRSRRVWGRVDPNTNKLVPYPTRQEFLAELGDDEEQAVLLWLDSPADAVLVEIEGSGRALLDDGTEVMVGFAGKNGRKSETRGVARQLRRFENRHGAKKWSAGVLDRYRRIVEQKASMVFFEIEARPGAIGSQNVVLTPRRSLAVDRAVVPLSTPVWVETLAPNPSKSKQVPWRHLLIAQDTGGAILGSVRGDIYWGDDEEAVEMGQRVNGPGRMWLLLPKTLSALPISPGQKAAGSVTMPALP